MNAPSYLFARRRNYAKSICAAVSLIALSWSFHLPSALADDAKAGKGKPKTIVAAEGLRQMGEALRKIQRAASELASEATRQDYVAVGDPDVVGTIIVPAIPEPSGMMAVGDYLPMRKEWLDYFLNQIGQLIPIYAKETDALVFPDSVKEQAIDSLKTMEPVFEDLKSHYMTLLNLTQPKEMSNTKVGEEAVMLHDDAKQLNDIRQRVFKLLKDADKQKPGKSS